MAMLHSMFDSNAATGSSDAVVMDDISVRSSRFAQRIRPLCKERQTDVPVAWRAVLALFRTTFDNITVRLDTAKVCFVFFVKKT